MTPAEFENLVEKNLIPAKFILFGDCDYLKSIFLNKLAERFINHELKPFNWDEFYCENLDEIDDVILALLSLPNFSSYRIVVLHNIERIKPSFRQRLKKLTIPETTILVFTSSSRDHSVGGLEELMVGFRNIDFSNPQGNELFAWVEYFFEENKKKVSRDVVQFLSESLPYDLFTVKNEIEKIIAYIGDKEVCTLDDVRRVFSGGREVTIYQYIRALRAKRDDDIISSAYELQTLGEGGVRFIYAVASELIKLLYVKLLKSEGATSNDCARELGVSSYFVSHLMRESDHFSLAELRELLDYLYFLELSFKSGELKEEYVPIMFSTKVVKRRL